MKKLILLLIFCSMSVYSQDFEIKQITFGDYNALNPFIPFYSFSNGWFLFEKHSSNSSNIILIKYDPISNSFQDTVEITSGNNININPYEDFNQGIVFQTNENGNWDVAYRSYVDGINWGPVIFLTNTTADEINLSPFYMNEIGFPGNSIIVYERSDTIIVLEYNETSRIEYPVLINTAQFHYSDYIGIQCFGFSGNYPRQGLHVIAVETDSAGSKNLISKYKPLSGNWETINVINEDCDCSNPILQYYEFTPYLIFEDSVSSFRRAFKVYDWDLEKNIEEIPTQTGGDIRNFRIDRLHIITENQNNTSQIELYPHSYFILDSNSTKLRLNKEQTGEYTTDTLISVKLHASKMALGSFGVFWGENFYTIWEDSIDGHIQLFGRWHNYPISDVEDNPKPLSFNLYQNYPNPFNPKTVIRYRLPVTSNVILKVYDVLGNEVATLVNEEKPSGEYEVEFSAKGGSASGGNTYNLPSGIYFYQLRVGDPETSSGQGMIQTKKMILLK